MRVGVVIAAYQAESFLSETIRSIAEQTHSDITCVIVDDGSQDGTFEVATEWSRLDGRFSAVQQQNTGVWTARNKGYALLPDDIDAVTFMDADDIWLPDTLERLLAVLRDRPELVGVHGLGDFIDLGGSWFDRGVFATEGRARVGCRGGRPRPWPHDAPTCFETVVTGSVIFPPGLVLVRAAVYRQIGVYDDRTGADGDWDLLIRIARLGDLGTLNDVILGYRRHPGNMSTGAGVAEACRMARLKAFYDPANNDEQRAIVSDSWRAVQLLDARERWTRARRALPRHPRSAARDLVRLPLIALRWARGRPRLAARDRRALGIGGQEARLTTERADAGERGATTKDL